LKEEAAMINLDGMTREELATALSETAQTLLDNYGEIEKNPKDAFESGRRLAYFEALDILRSRIEICGGTMDEIILP